MKKLVMRCGCWWLPGACSTAGSIRARRRPVSASPGLPPPAEPPLGLDSGCRCPSAAAASLGFGSFSSMLLTVNPKQVLPGSFPNQSSARTRLHSETSALAPRSLPRACAAAAARAGVQHVAGWARSGATFGSTSRVSKTPRVSALAHTPGDSKEVLGFAAPPRSTQSQRSRGHPGRPADSARLFSASGYLRLRRCRLGRPGLTLHSCRPCAPRRSSPPGSARAVPARVPRQTLEGAGRERSARPPPPASTWRRPGGPRCAPPAPGPPAHGRRPAAGRGAPPACGRAPAEPRRAPRPEAHG